MNPELLYTHAFNQTTVEKKEKDNKGKEVTNLYHMRYYHDIKSYLTIIVSAVSKNKLNKKWKEEIDRLFRYNKVPEVLTPDYYARKNIESRLNG